MKALSTKKLNNLSPEIMLIFGKLQSETPQEYFDVKLNVLNEFYFPGAERVREKAPKGVKLKLVAQKNLPKIPKAIQKNIECLLETVDANFPLLTNEIIMNDFVSVLKEDFEEIPAGTVVLERTTNFAVLYFVVLNLRIEGDSAKPIAQEVEIEEEEREAVTELFAVSSEDITAGGVVKFIASNFASGMVSAVGGAIVNAILDEIFPPGVPSYFDEVYAEISKIVGQRIQQSKIDSINGAINNVVQKVNNEYLPAREQSNLKKEKDRKRLFNLLQKYDQTFLSGPGGMLGTLQQKDNAHAGFSVFMIGASLQLSLLQEMANVDPYNGNEKEGWKPANKSSYGKPKTGTLAKTAKDFADFADKTLKEIVAKRRKQIDTEKFAAYFKVRRKSKYAAFQPSHWARIVDNGVATGIEKRIYSDKKDGSNHRYDSFRANELKKYRNEQEVKLREKMNNPGEVIANWRKLIATPIRLK